MAKNRIKVEGVWYVKEDEDNVSTNFDPTYYKGITIEDSDVCLEASVIFKDKGFIDMYDSGAAVMITYKKDKDKKSEYVDNPGYLKKILKKNKVPKDLLPSCSHNMMIQLCKEMDRLGWI